MSAKSPRSSVHYSDLSGDDTTSANDIEQAESWSTWVENGWLLEVLSLIAGCGLLAGLCLILKLYDGQQNPRIGTSMGAAITLNTVIAIAGAAIQALLLYPIIECLSQFKWSWLTRQSRRLTDIQTFDSASRGAIGSLRLLYKFGHRTPATIGATLIIVAVALTPFFQQLISIGSHRIPVDNTNNSASIPITRTYLGNMYQQDVTINLASDIAALPDGGFVANSNQPATMATNLRGAIEIGFYSPYGGVFPLVPSCSTGNCTLNSYQTLAVCSRVANISHLLVEHNFVTSYNQSIEGFRLSVPPATEITWDSLSSGPGGTTGVFMNVSSIMGSYNTSSVQSPSFEHNRTAAFADAVIIAATMPSAGNRSVSAGPHGRPLANYKPVAFEVLLEWCVLNYTTVVENGMASTSVVQSMTNFTTENTTLSIAGSITMSDTNLTYQYGSGAQSALELRFQDIFAGQIEDGDGDLYTSSAYAQAIWESLTSADGSHPDGLNIGAVMSNIATSLSNTIRSIQSQDYQNSTGSNVTGTAYINTTIVVVRWHWVAGPVVFAAFATAFVILTVILSMHEKTRTHAWRSSGLAMLTALDPELQRNLGSLSRPSQLSSVAENIRVRLVPVAGGSWRLLPSAIEDKQSKPLPSILHDKR